MTNLDELIAQLTKNRWCWAVAWNGNYYVAIVNKKKNVTYIGDDLSSNYAHLGDTPFEALLAAYNDPEG